MERDGRWFLLRGRRRSVSLLLLFLLLTNRVCSQEQLRKMLPDAGTYHFPWEINSALIPEGKTLRTFGRLHSYDVVSSQAILTAQQTSVQHIIQVCTKFVEPFQAQLGALYIVLGKLNIKRVMRW
ncbi:CST complex subunit TEN1 [Podarcis lilfordi]|uniref:CST complex subunit TEN1 n=1 Tax=Podarcis lilfordi TaxID=74358 RepID=A0AA35JU14_9SAUR|nr:CST complex subunit TEN1 [Podarcis lilfordi]